MVPESDVDGVVFDVLPADVSADGVVVVVEELSSAANATAAPPPTRAPVKASATADFWIHFMVITSSMVSLLGWLRGTVKRLLCKNGARTRAVRGKIADQRVNMGRDVHQLPSTGKATMHGDDMILISVDDHIAEPADMFDAHVPAKYREFTPRVETDERGDQQWWYGELKGRNLGLNAVAGKPRELFNVNPSRYDHMRPGCFDVHERVRDMSAGGQLAGLNFPNWTGFSGQVLNQGPDPDVNLVMIHAYNDWHVDEWCGAYPERFIPCGILPLWDPELAAKEVRRLADKGCHAVTFSENPEALNMPSIHSGNWDPLFARVRRSRHRVVLPRRVVVEGVVHHERRARQRADDPLVDDERVHARRPDVGRLLVAIPHVALLAHRRRHRVDSRTSCSAPSTCRTATRVGHGTAFPTGKGRATCSWSASCAVSSTTRSV